MSPWLWVCPAAVVAVLVLAHTYMELRRIAHRYQKRRQFLQDKKTAMLERHAREDEEMERWIAEVREQLEDSSPELLRGLVRPPEAQTPQGASGPQKGCWRPHSARR